MKEAVRSGTRWVRRKMEGLGCLSGEGWDY